MNGWQADPRALTDCVWDVAIVGGGPAGAVAALHLARGGLRIALLERFAYPREKVCGDALIADSIRVLERCGLLCEIVKEARETSALQLFSPRRLEVMITSRALIIKRSRLDEIIARAAATAGAAIAIGHVDNIVRGPTVGLSVRGQESLVMAKILIVATGADIHLLKPMAMVARTQPSVVAIRRYIRSTAKIDHLVFAFQREIAPGYAWLFPLRDGEYNVGCGAAYGGRRVDLAKVLDAFMRDFGPLKEFAAGITEETPVRGALLRCGLSGTDSFRSPNVLCIGESIGSTFPLTGEGIGKAMETGELAAALILRALAEKDMTVLEAFPALVGTLRPRYRGYEIAERWLARPWLTDLVTFLARRSEYARRCAEEVLNETADPRSIFSVSSLLKMLRS